MHPDHRPEADHDFDHPDGDRYDGFGRPEIELADDPFAGLDLDSAYAELEEIER